MPLHPHSISNQSTSTMHASGDRFFVNSQQQQQQTQIHVVPRHPLHSRQTSSHSRQYPPHVLAQKLNNKGATLLEEGNLEKAISYLGKSLKLAEKTAQEAKARALMMQQQQQQQHWQHTPEQQQILNFGGMCLCEHCQLETCMVVSTDRQSRRMETSSSHHRMRTDAPLSPSLQKRKHQGGTSALSMSTIQDCENGDDAMMVDESCLKPTRWQGGYLYAQTLRVSPVAIHEQHFMGVTLSLTVLFNLALAHQLSAVTAESKSQSLRLLKKARQLYELAYQLQVEEHPSSSLRFTMCIANNLSEIHRVEGKFDRYQACLQHLLSTMMYMVDCQLPILGAGNEGNNALTSPQAQELMRRRRQQVASVELGDEQQHIDEEYWMQELDGFFRNASRIILTDHTAAAA